MVLSAGTGDGEKRVDELASLDRRLSVLEEAMARLFNALTDSSVNAHFEQK
jgi:hypothetical protein